MKKIIISILLCASAVHAGQERGNGGDAVVCYKPGFKDQVVRDPKQIVSVELLDLYEGRVFKNMLYTFSPATDYLGVAKEQIAKLKTLSPLRHFLFIKDLATFEDDTIFLSGTQLQDIDDSAHIAIPLNCKIEQLVIQKNPEFPGDKRYSIDGDLWNLMDAANRSATITHEFFYKELSPLAQNSRGVRHINALLNSKNFLNLTTSLWFVHQHFVKTRFVEYDNLIFSRWGISPASDENPGGQFSNYWTKYATVTDDSSSDEFKSIGYQNKPIGTVFGKDLSSFEHLTVWAKCDFTTCQFANITAVSIKGIKNSNKILNLNIPESLILNAVYFDQKGIAKKVSVNSDAPEILLVLPQYTVSANVPAADLYLSSTGQWTIKDSSLYFADFSKQKMRFTRYQGTVNIQLEAGELSVIYENGPTLNIPLKIDNHLGKSFVIGNEGQIESIWLKGFTKGGPSERSQELLFVDGTMRKVCEGEKVNFDEKMKAIVNPDWKLLKYSGLQDCLGSPRD